MNNSMYTTIPPEVEYIVPMSPDEEMEHYYSTCIEEPIDEPEITMREVKSEIDSMFYNSGYTAKCDDRPVDPEFFWRVNYGIQTPKKETKYVIPILEEIGIPYVVKEGAWRKVNGRLTGKSLNFIEFENGEDDYYTLFNNLHKIPVLIGEDL